MTARYHANVPVDRLDRPDRALLLFGHKLVDIGPLGVAIHTELTDQSLDVEQLKQRLVELLGAPTGDLDELVEGALGQLVDVGAVNRSFPED